MLSKRGGDYGMKTERLTDRQTDRQIDITYLFCCHWRIHAEPERNTKGGKKNYISKCKHINTFETIQSFNDIAKKNSKILAIKSEVSSWLKSRSSTLSALKLSGMTSARKLVNNPGLEVMRVFWTTRNRRLTALHRCFRDSWSWRLSPNGFVLKDVA